MRIILFDLDETLIDGRVIDSLAVNYGFEGLLQRLRLDLIDGSLSHENLTKYLAWLLEGKRVDEIERVIDQIPLMPNTERVLSSLKKQGFNLGVVSDGFTVATDHISKRLVLDCSIAHETPTKNGRLTGEMNFTRNGVKYSTWKREVVKELRRKSNSRIIAIGNGDLDAPMLKEADVGIAFNGTPKAKNSADIVIDSKDMRDVLEAIESVGSPQSEV